MYKISVKCGSTPSAYIRLLYILREKMGFSLREAEHCANQLTGAGDRALELPILRKDLSEDLMSALEEAGFKCCLYTIESGEYNVLASVLDDVREPYWERSERLLEEKGVLVPRKSGLFERSLDQVIGEIERVPEISTPHLQRAAYFLLADDAEAAANECRETIRLLAHGRVFHKLQEARFLLGCSLNQLGQRQAARAEWEWILQQTPLEGVHEAAVKAGNIRFSLYTVTHAMLERYPAP